MSEICLRAIAQIGKLSRELEKSKGGANPKATLLSSEKSKEEQLKDAGLSTSTANRYEQLASPSAQAAPAVEAAMKFPPVVSSKQSNSPKPGLSTTTANRYEDSPSLSPVGSPLT